MEAMLVLVVYILIATGIAWLVYWGAGQVGMAQTPRVIVAGIVFVLLLLFALNNAGVMTL